VRAVNVERRGGQSVFEVRATGSRTAAITLNLPRTATTYLNALAAIAVGTELEVDDAPSTRAGGFPGHRPGACSCSARWRIGGRRRTLVTIRPPPDQRSSATLERRARPGRAPHPARVRAAPATTPHPRLLDDFAQVLSTADALVVAESTGRRGTDPGRGRPSPVPRDPLAGHRRAGAAQVARRAAARARRQGARRRRSVLTGHRGSIGACGARAAGDARRGRERGGA